MMARYNEKYYICVRMDFGKKERMDNIQERLRFLQMGGGEIDQRSENT